MSQRLDGIKFRVAGAAGTPDSPSSAEHQGLDAAKFRAGYALAAPEPIPILVPEDVTRGMLIDDDYKTRIAGYWQFFREPWLDSFQVHWPDQAWKWVKHPFGGYIPSFGVWDGVTGAPLDFPSGEIFYNKFGFWGRRQVQFNFRSSGKAISWAGAPGLTGYNYTAIIKFAWGGGVQDVKDGSFNLGYQTSPRPSWSGHTWGSAGGGLFGDVSLPSYAPVYGAYVSDVVLSPFTGDPKTFDTGDFVVEFHYGVYDPGPGDAGPVGLTYSYPIQSLKYPDSAWNDQDIPSDNGAQGKYTYVQTCDGTRTWVGMAPGWNPSSTEIEWFGRLEPFLYNEGGPSTGDVHMVPAFTAYPPPSWLGYLVTGGFLGRDAFNWNGVVYEYLLSSVPFDLIILDKMGSLVPQSGYPHLDMAKFRSSFT
jgi:hypothetical protein